DQVPWICGHQQASLNDPQPSLHDVYLPLGKLPNNGVRPNIAELGNREVVEVPHVTQTPPRHVNPTSRCQTLHPILGGGPRPSCWWFIGVTAVMKRICPGAVHLR